VTLRHAQVLVVEDDVQIRELVADALAGEGFRVATAPDADTALNEIERRHFDLLVTDIRLPGGRDGFDLVRSARANEPALKSLFISGDAAPPGRTEAVPPARTARLRLGIAAA